MVFFQALLLFFSPQAQAALDPQKVFNADLRKNKFYVKDGLTVGGDRNVDDVVVLAIRHAVQPDYERFVVDLEGNGEGESIAIQRAPYYQVAVQPDSSRVVVTVWGSPKIGFDPKKAMTKLKTNSVVSKVELLPILEKDRWSFVVHLKTPSAVEVFELSNPVRIILDIRTAAR